MDLLDEEKIKQQYIDLTKKKINIKNEYDKLKNYQKYLNRFDDIIAIESTRVNLKESINDYINANYVNGCHSLNDYKSNHYIATQAPLEDTIYDFWIMVWEKNINMIVMLVSLSEGSRKVVNYWSDLGTNKLEIYQMSISVIKEDDYDYFVRRKILLNYKGEDKIIYHYNFYKWPDHGTPHRIDDFYNFICYVQKEEYYHNKNKSPIIVHCSAGVGRTGCYILIDSIIKFIRENKNKPVKVSPINLLRYIRDYRIELVQTPDQFLFCIKVICSIENYYKYLKL